VTAVAKAIGALPGMDGAVVAAAQADIAGSVEVIEVVVRKLRD